MKWFQRLSAVCILLITLLVARPGLAAPGDTTRVSVDSTGVQLSNWSNFPSISGDGRYVAFEHADNILVYDSATGATTYILSGSSHSGTPSISSDGRDIAFWSDVAMAGDTNGTYDVFVYDGMTRVITRVSVDSSGGQGNDFSAGGLSISANGRYVLFRSNATNLVSGDTNGVPDVFVHDRTTGATTRVSVSTGGGQANNSSDTPSNSAISADGRYVAFRSDATNLVPGDTNGERDIFVHDRTTGVTTRVSIDSTGGQGNGDSQHLSISADGRYVAFVSSASNLISGDSNGAFDLFVHDRITGATERVSVATGGGQGNGNVIAPSISADGRYVTFSSTANNLVSSDTNSNSDIFVHDRTTGTTTLASMATDGTQGNSNSDYPAISADGHYVAFHSWATNLVPGDTNGQVDVFLHQLGYVPPPTMAPAAANARSLPNTGFAPGRVTILSPQTVFYTDPGDLWLEIPKLGVKMPIVGVPKKNDAWDVSWLGSQAGWLEGSAFPSWNGNSVLTGHVWNADNSPGPFLKLNTLWWSDKVIIHAFGQKSIYEVRSVEQVASTNISAMRKHEELSWLTLITCRGYDEGTNAYRYRIIVRAVLVEVK